MSVINSQPLIGASGNQSTAYNLTRSLRFRSSASAYLNRTPASAGNRRTWTWSGWVKRGRIGTGAIQGLFAGVDSSNSQIVTGFRFTGSDNLELISYNGSYTSQLVTTQVFRDPSAWYHLVAVYDTTQATASNRAKIYVNGVQVTTLSTASYPSQNYDGFVNTTGLHVVSAAIFSSVIEHIDGYLAEVNFIDGQALDASSFGETDTATGVWKPKKYTGTYGTNGYYLKFDNLTSTSTLGNDSSGNGNNWTVNNISLTSGATYDSMKDVPTLTDADTANYGTWNPIGNGGGSISNGNLRSSTSSVTPDVGTFAMTSGKWYWEVTVTTASNPRVGVYDIGSSAPSNLGANANGWAIINSPSRIYFNGSTTNYGSFNGSNGDVVMVAYDADAGNLWFGANNSWFASGNPATAANPSATSVTGKSIVPAVASGTGSNVFDLNCGQRPFAYTPPSGFKALNTFNLPTPTIGATASTQANDYFDINTWTGNGSTQNIVNSGAMQPDLVWYKSRSNSGYDHYLIDSVRGTTKWLGSSSTSAEQTVANSLTAFNSNGFTLGSDAGGNQNTLTYVGWQWRASNATGVSNTAGTITSTVSANTTAGFSIVTYTGTGSNATVGHGLGVAPSMIIVKSRSSGLWSWGVWHKDLSGSTPLLTLNTTNAVTNSFNAFRTASMSSTVIGIGDEVTSNQSTGTYVAYCFAEVAGYSRFGSYTGNGSSDGPFVYTGFRPKFVMVKSSSAAGESWFIADTSRGTFNVITQYLVANSADAEGSTAWIDSLSNGFKIRFGGAGPNTNGATYIYAAFAETPFKYSLGR